MYKRILLLCLLGTSLWAAAQPASIPAELKPFIQKGFTVLDFSRVDMNGDKRPDYVLILKKEGEDTIGVESADWESPRPLLIITRQSGNVLKVAAENDELVLCSNCGGALGDPYQGLQTKPGQFTVDFYGGSSWRWGDRYTFAYDAAKKDWFLQLNTATSFHAGEPESTTRIAAIRRSEIGDLSLKNYTPGYNADSSEWEVSAAKTNFYDSPEVGSKPRKGYLVRGDKVVSLRAFRNFIECSYSKDGIEFTDGYILKKDLRLLKAHPPAAVQ